MELFSPKEICGNILRGVTTRQITDLAELKIIVPARDSTGRGVSRLYDTNGVIDIAVACSLRIILPPHLVKHIVAFCREALTKADKGEIAPWDLFIIKRIEKGGIVGTMVVSYGDVDGQSLRFVDMDEESESQVYTSRRERENADPGKFFQEVPLDWNGKQLGNTTGSGACNPLDHRIIILNITDLKREIEESILAS